MAAWSISAPQYALPANISQTSSTAVMHSKLPTGYMVVIPITTTHLWQPLSYPSQKPVFYGNNRADFSAIPGNMAPGVLFRQPDHFENYDDWPFLWGQNEGTIAGNTSYVIFGHAFRDLVR